MAEYSGFFPDVSGDREYTHDFLAQWVHSFISNGVYNSDLAVTVGSNMQIVIPAGQAWINGYYYKNNCNLVLPIANADGVLKRKDTVVLRWDINSRKIAVQVLTGTFSSNPTVPAIVRSVEQFDLKLAEIDIPAGATAVSQSNITDTRLDSNLCGIVHAVIDHIDTTTFLTQLNTWAQEYEAAKQAEFTSWFNNVKGQLSTDAAGNLQTQITDLRAQITDMKNANYVKTADLNSYGIGTTTLKSITNPLDLSLVSGIYQLGNTRDCINLPTGWTGGIVEVFGIDNENRKVLAHMTVGTANGNPPYTIWGNIYCRAIGTAGGSCSWCGWIRESNV